MTKLAKIHERGSERLLLDKTQMSLNMCPEALHLLLQLVSVDISQNSLSGTLPSSWAGLTEASCAALNLLHVQFRA